MALVFPTLSSGWIMAYPLTDRHKWRTEVMRHIDLSEQRYSMGVELEEFDLEFHNLSTTDKETIRSFFTSTRGSFDTTWTLKFKDTNGILQTYTYMQFTGDFSPEMTANGVWSIRLTVKQTRG
jgi:hypothetical protein